MISKILFFFLCFVSFVDLQQSSCTWNSITSTQSCMPVVTTYNEPSCLHRHIFLMIFLGEGSDFRELPAQIKKLLYPCEMADRNQAVKSKLTMISANSANSFRLNDSRIYNISLFNQFIYSSSVDSQIDWDNLMCDAIKEEKNETLPRVLYIITNIKCSTYLHFPSASKWFADIGNFTLTVSNRNQLPTVFFWIDNDVEELSKCDMDVATYASKGWFSYTKVNLSQGFYVAQYGMCYYEEKTSPTIQSPTTDQSVPIEQTPPINQTTPSPDSGGGGTPFIKNLVFIIGVIVLSLIGIVVSILVGRRFLCPHWMPWVPILRKLNKWLSYEDSPDSFRESNRIPIQESIHREYDYPEFDKKIDDEWEMEPLALQISSEKLGSGAYAVVFKGVLRGVPPVMKVFPTMQLRYVLSDSENMVAVKMTKGHATDEDRRDFLQEIMFMKRLEYHPHILSLLGCSTDIKYPILVTELCSNGNLLELLRNMKEETCVLQNSDLIPICWQISDALTYLSAKNIIHRDVAARNVLIKDCKMAMLSDFGLCRYSDEMFYTTRGGKLPIKWMAPESLEFARFTAKTDVWSFGVFLFEVFSRGKTPYPSTQAEQMLHYLKSGKRLQIPEETPEIIVGLMEECWRNDGDDRPAFPQIRRTLYSLLEANSDSYGYLEFSQQFYRTLKDTTLCQIDLDFFVNKD